MGTIIYSQDPNTSVAVDYSTEFSQIVAALQTIATNSTAVKLAVESIATSASDTRIITAVESIAVSTNDIAVSTNDIAVSTNDLVTSTEDIALSNNVLAEQTIATRIAAVNDGTVHQISITDSGNGYTAVPEFTISDPETGTNIATASVTVSEGKLEQFTITNSGSNYRVPPKIIIGPPTEVVAPVTFSAGLSVSAGDYVNYLQNYYQVVSPESPAIQLGNSGPTHTSGVQENGTAVLKYVGRQATATAILGGGAGTKTVNPYDLLTVASMYSYYINNPNEITALLDAVQKPNGSTDIDRLKLLSNFVNNLPKLP